MGANVTHVEEAVVEVLASGLADAAVIRNRWVACLRAVPSHQEVA